MAIPPAAFFAAGFFLYVQNVFDLLEIVVNSCMLKSESCGCDYFRSGTVWLIDLHALLFGSCSRY